MSGPLRYLENPEIAPRELGDLFKSSGINRPLDDQQRLRKMLQHANLVIGAYCDDELVGVARALTDFSYCCYLSDLAVAVQFQHQGIGEELVRRVRERIGDQSMLLLLSAPEAMEYYPKIGFEQIQNAFVIRRSR